MLDALKAYVEFNLTKFSDELETADLYKLKALEFIVGSYGVVLSEGWGDYQRETVKSENLRVKNQNVSLKLRKFCKFSIIDFM